MERLEDRRVFAGDVAESMAPQVSPAWFAEVRELSGASISSNARESMNARRGSKVTWVVQLQDDVAASTTLRDTPKLFQDARFGVEVLRGLGGNGQILVQTTSRNQGMVRNYFSSKSFIESFAQDRKVRALDITNDPLYAGSQWSLNNTQQSGGTADADIDAPEAWASTRGDRSIVVGVIDTGIDYRHSDLRENMWVNPGEVKGNGMDDDGNGFVDDVYGYDFANNDSDPMDDQGHGSHVAGTIGATGDNGIGISGVAQEVSLMALKVLDANGSGNWSNALRAINYTTMMKGRFGVNVRATNNSYGGTSMDTVTQKLFTEAINAGGSQDILFVAAAGNDSSNNDRSPMYPASINSPYVLSVGATNQWDEAAYFSNYGAKTVDVFAPGMSILSTLPGENYKPMNGTSMAAPHVVGAAVLAWSMNPSLTALQVSEAIVASVDKLDSLKSLCVAEGRLNVSNLVNGLGSRVSIADARVVEGSPGFRSMQFEVRLDKPSTEDIRIDYKTLDGTALAGRDYQSAQGTVMIPAGGVSTIIAITFWGNKTVDGDRFFNVVLTDVIDAKVDRYLAAGTIADDDIATAPGVFRGGLNWYLDNANNGNLAEQVIRFGLPGDIPVVGDWDGDGYDNVGIVRAGANGMLNWYLDTNGDLNPEIVIAYGLRGDKVVVGDWDGDGKDNVGVVRAGANGLGQWLLDTDRDPTHEIHFEFGFNSDQPVTGDWNGDGIGDAGVARKSAGLLQWFLDTNRDPWADRTLNFGFNTDVPIVGDWDGDGRDEVGVVRNRRDWYLDVAGDGQYAERVVSFGLSGDVPMPGKWKPTSGASNGNQSQMVAAVPLSSFDLDNLLNGTNASQRKRSALNGGAVDQVFSQLQKNGFRSIW